MTRLGPKLRRLGALQGTRHVLPLLAMEVAQAAQNHEVSPEDALEVYVDYFKASSRLKTIDPYDKGVQANVSKLRQIIKAADPDLLRRVTRIRDKLSAKYEVRPLYQAIVLACRLKNHLDHGKQHLPDAVLARIVRR